MEWKWVDDSPVLRTNWYATRNWGLPTRIFHEGKEVLFPHTVWESIRVSQPTLYFPDTCTALIPYDVFDWPWISVPCDLELDAGYFCEKPVVDYTLFEESPPTEEYKTNGLYHYGVFSQNDRNDSMSLFPWNYTCRASEIMINSFCIMIVKSDVPPKASDLISPEDIHSVQPLHSLLMLSLFHMDTRDCLMMPSWYSTKCAIFCLEIDKEKLLPEHLVTKLSDSCDNGSSYITFQHPTIYHAPGCFQGHFECVDGSCILDIHQCDGRSHCSDSSDEESCIVICVNTSAPNFRDINSQNIPSDNSWCAQYCVQPGCVCGEMFFQCHSGGCISLSFLCDGKSQCSDSSDEIICLSDEPELQCEDPTQCPEVSFELICPSGDRQNQSVENNVMRNDRNTPQTFPCLGTNGECFPFNVMCIFDRLTDGHIMYCQNGRHLEKCIEFQCPGMFKCAFSYCIPFHLVCNGISDCPDADDELSCPPDNCPNLFRCSLETTCIDLGFIQDGKLHCPQSQEDELGFHIPKCPQHCHCFGYTLECAGKQLTHIPEYHVDIKVLFFKENRLSSLQVFSKGTFYSGVLQIDLSNNSLSAISTNSLKRLKNLLFLDISCNNFVHLQGNIFQSLTSLLVLEIQKNPLRTIASTSLLGLHALTLLNMSNMFLGNIPIGSFMDLKRLVILDLSQNRLYRLENQLFSGLISLKQLDLKGNKITEVG